MLIFNLAVVQAVLERPSNLRTSLTVTPAGTTETGAESRAVEGVGPDLTPKSELRGSAKEPPWIISSKGEIISFAEKTNCGTIGTHCGSCDDDGACATWDNENGNCCYVGHPLSPSYDGANLVCAEIANSRSTTFRTCEPGTPRTPDPTPSPTRNPTRSPTVSPGL